MHLFSPLWLVLLYLHHTLMLAVVAAEQTKTTFHMRPISTCKGHEKEKAPPKELSLIAIMAGSTTRNVKDAGTDSIALFTVLLPSLLRSLDCGYRYVYVLGFDAGDGFYDSKEGMSLVEAWFASRMTSVLQGNGIEMSLKPVRVVNDMRKPGMMCDDDEYIYIKYCAFCDSKLLCHLLFYSITMYQAQCLTPWPESPMTWEPTTSIVSTTTPKSEAGGRTRTSRRCRGWVRRTESSVRRRTEATTAF